MYSSTHTVAAAMQAFGASCCGSLFLSYFRVCETSSRRTPGTGCFPGSKATAGLVCGAALLAWSPVGAALAGAGGAALVSRARLPGVGLPFVCPRFCSSSSESDDDDEDEDERKCRRLPPNAVGPSECSTSRGLAAVRIGANRFIVLDLEEDEEDDEDDEDE